MFHQIQFVDVSIAGMAVPFQLCENQCSYAVAWLLENGHDPEGDLCAPRRSRAKYRDTLEVFEECACTAMVDACGAGELVVCQWLYAHGAASTIRVRDSNGRKPMYAACWMGQLHVAKWLYAVGAAEDVDAKSRRGKTNLMIAAMNGHLDVVRWLFQVSAVANVIHITDSKNLTPLRAACKSSRADGVVLWLVVQGAANDEATGHVSPALLDLSIPSYHYDARQALRSGLDAHFRDHASFARLVLPAAAGVAKDSEPMSPLALLRGHENTIGPLIADFAGVVRGRPLRNVREALVCFARHDLDVAERRCREGCAAERAASEARAAAEAAEARAMEVRAAAERNQRGAQLRLHQLLL